MGWLLRLAFFLVPAAELALFAVMWSRIGLGWALLAVAATALVGAGLVRRQGLAVWEKMREDLAAGGTPARHLAHGVLLLVGGALLLTPGFLTDGAGFALMFPPVREALYNAGVRRLRRRAVNI